MMHSFFQYWWSIRIVLPLLGGAWGAWFGFRPFFNALEPANSMAAYGPLGNVFIAGFGLFNAAIGMAVCMLICGAILALVEPLLRRIGIGIAGALIVSSLLSGLAIWQLTDFVQEKYAGFRTAVKEKPHISKPPTPADKQAQHNSCLYPRPKGDKEGQIWDLECL